MNDTIETHEEKQDKGFTLVELLIVIVILGILATVTVFAVGGITSTAEQNACETELATAQTAVEAHFVDTGTYPAAGDWAALTPGYLREAPSDASITLAADGVVTGCT